MMIGIRRVLTLLALGLAVPVVLGGEVVSRPGGMPPDQKRTRVLRTWNDTIKVEGRDVARRVEVVFDYDEGLARELAYGVSGNLLGSLILYNQPAPAAEEAAEAVEIIRADRSLGRVLKQTGGQVEGVFVLQEREGKPCGPRTRCLQVLLMSKDGSSILRRVVVDLTKGTIVYRDYVPGEGEVTK